MKKTFTILVLTILCVSILGYKVYQSSKAESPVQGETQVQAESSVQAESPAKAGTPAQVESPVQAEVPSQAETGTVEESGNIDNDAGNDVSDKNLEYSNPEYGFSFSLPSSWEGYTIINGTWEDNAGSQSGPTITIRHPEWTEENPRQDIPIMVFTHEQWTQITNEELLIGAGPMGPSFLNENDKYVFALPARYNYAFPAGFEEVDEIMKNNPIKVNDNLE